MAPSSILPGTYRRHEPEHTVWHPVVREHLEAFLDEEDPWAEIGTSERGHPFPDEVRMSRFVRVVDDEARRELILFHFEPLAPTGFASTDFVEGGTGASSFDALSAECTTRSEAAFRVEEH